MTALDLNLLTALDALLQEKSVTAAAKKLDLSTSAMSRTLSRLRAATGDPILVAAGRGMVPTPHAEALAGEVRALLSGVRTVLTPSPGPTIETLKRDFTIRANEAFVLLHAARIWSLLTAIAPGVRLRFAPRSDKEVHALRDAEVDLDIGLMPPDMTELRCQVLFKDDYIGVARTDHPLFAARSITAERFAGAGHVVFSPRDDYAGTIDDVLAERGLSRDVRLIVPSFPAVIAVAAASDLIGFVPRSYYRPESANPVRTFELPVTLPGIPITQSWHPRMDADPAHRWLRATIFGYFKGLA